MLKPESKTYFDDDEILNNFRDGIHIRIEKLK